MAVVVTDPAPPEFTADGPGTPATAWQAALEPATRAVLTLEGVRRLVVVSAHPDDESLGAGALIASATAAGLQVELVCATEGELSHPRSPTHVPDDVALLRAEEYVAAARELGVGVPSLRWLGLPDGAVDKHLTELTDRLVEIVGDGSGTAIVATWSQDGHPDHGAVGRAAAATARRTDAELWEFPVWFWHWASPDDGRASRLRPFRATRRALEAKRRAVEAHRSQVAPLSPLAGDEALLAPELLAHFRSDHEWFVVTPGADCRDDELDELHGALEDPWGVDSRWYERRKRELLLAALPRPRFRRALEVGCSTGALTEALAGRADHVLAVDRSRAALAAAQRRLGDRPDVALDHLDVPAEWPSSGRFDLVVVSEVGYFLSPAALDGLVERIAHSLDPDGVVVLCHWRHPIEGWLLDADEVHRRFEGDQVPPLQAVYRDRDVEIRVHAADWPASDR